MKCGGIILCGGHSTRMGVSKASLPFGGETMLARVARILGRVVDPVVVVAAAGQKLPSDLPTAVRVAYDRYEGRGPLEGLIVGLEAITPLASAAYVTGCDVPRLTPSFIRRMIGLVGQYDIVVPRDGRYHHPLAAVYRTSVRTLAQRLLDANQLRPFYLFAQARTREVPVGELTEADPELGSLENVNCGTDYVAAAKSAGFRVPDEVLAQLRLGESDRPM